jgi:hypothetical protein
MTNEQIDARIAELKQQLEKLVGEANRAIGELSGRIAELERIKAEAVKAE